MGQVSLDENDSYRRIISGVARSRTYDAPAGKTSKARQGAGTCKSTQRLFSDGIGLKYVNKKLHPDAYQLANGMQ